jgi:hypothetical protein
MLENGKNNNICNKCGKQFCNKYSLQNHLNRKNPCDSIIQCDICKKIFKRNLHLTDHKNRKNPCQPSSNALEIIEADKKAKLEIIHAKKEACLEIEKEKSKRKATTNIDNSTNTNNYYTFNYAPNISYVDFNEKNMKKHINKNILQIPIDEFGNVIADDTKVKPILIKLLELLYNNTNFPEYKNLIYTPTCDKFFAIHEKEFHEVSYEEIKPIIANNLLRITSTFRDKYNSEANYEECYLDKFNKISENSSDGKYRQFNIVLSNCDNVVSIINRDAPFIKKESTNNSNFKSMIKDAIDENGQTIKVINWD